MTKEFVFAWLNNIGKFAGLMLAVLAVIVIIGLGAKYFPVLFAFLLIFGLLALFAYWQTRDDIRRNNRK